MDEAILLGRVEQRIKPRAPPRSDDNPETAAEPPGGLSHAIPRRCSITTGKQGKVVTVDGMAPIDSVTAAISAALDKKR